MASRANPTTEKTFWELTLERFEKAADLVGMDADVHRILSQPKTIVQVNFPVRLDGGGYRLFQGYRIQHNNILGPYIARVLRGPGGPGSARRRPQERLLRGRPRASAESLCGARYLPLSSADDSIVRAVSGAGRDARPRER